MNFVLVLQYKQYKYSAAPCSRAHFKLDFVHYQIDKRYINIKT